MICNWKPFEFETLLQSSKNIFFVAFAQKTKRPPRLCILSGEIGGGSTEALICLGISVSVGLGSNGSGCSHGMLFSESYGEYDVDIVALGA